MEMEGEKEKEEESILGFEWDCADEGLSPIQIQEFQKAEEGYNRVFNLLENWKKNKRKVVSHTSGDLQMYSSKQPIQLQLQAKNTTTLTNNNQIIRTYTSSPQGINRVGGGIVTSQPSLLLHSSASYPTVLRHTRPIQISSVQGGGGLRQQSPIVTSVSSIRNPTPATPPIPVQQLIFDTNSGLLLLPHQASQQGVTTMTTTMMTRPTITPSSIQHQPPRATYTQVQTPVRTPNFRRPTPFVPNSNPPPANLKTYQTPKIVSSTSLNQGMRAVTPKPPPLIPLAPKTAAGTKDPTAGPSARPGAKTAGAAKAPAAAGAGEAEGSNRTFPSLVVNVKPCLQDKPTKVKMADARTDLDGKVKSLLIYTSAKFTEWLMQKGLLRLEHKCTSHTLGGKEHLPYKLGMYSDGTKQPSSGGYVWISECCPDKQITVFQGSIFEASVYPPGTLLKLIYHWSCQTTATNVLQWVKVTSYYLKNFYTLLRSACVAALHEFCPLMGGKSKFVEVGIITLGTTLAVQNGQKQVKVEILGVFDPTTKIIRMKVINPQNAGQVASASHSRVMQILWPLNHWVDKSSIILIDTSIEKSLLLEMGFKHVHQCQSSQPTNVKSSTPTNVNVMNYLKHVVPKMFQNTLCVLSKSLIQQFLDELSWRELWGETPAATFDMIISHLVHMTKWDTGESLISRLNRISLNPFGEWSNSRGRGSRAGIEMLPDSIRGTSDMPELVVQAPLISKSNGTGVNRGKTGGNNRGSLGGLGSKPPVLIPQVIQTPAQKRKLAADLNGGVDPDFSRHYFSEAKNLILQAYYYAEYPRNPLTPVSAEFPSNLKCPLCSKLFISNQEIVRHIFMHVQSVGIRAGANHGFCEYCLKDVGPVSALQSHVNEVHKLTDVKYACLICQEKFGTEMNLTLHMWEYHGKSEMPYKCETCDYRSSFHHDVVNHFSKEHCGSDSVLCPLCLKVLTAKSFTCMKQIVVHIQSHTIRKGKKCTQCTLTFNGDMEYRAHLYDNSHQMDSLLPSDREPIPFQVEVGVAIKMANPPKVSRAVVQTQMPPLKKVPRLETTTTTTRKPLIREGVGVQFQCSDMDLKFLDPAIGATKCRECNEQVGNEEHFSGYMVCLKCRFATCCQMAMNSHSANVHPNPGEIKLQSSLALKEKDTDSEDNLEFACACGFKAKSGLKIAKHLVRCEKTTAKVIVDGVEDEEEGEGTPADGTGTSASTEATTVTGTAAAETTAEPEAPNLLDQLGLTRR